MLEIPTGLDLSIERLILTFWTTSTITEGKVPPKEIQIYCPEASLVLLHMIRKMINEVYCSLYLFFCVRSIYCLLLQYAL